MLSIQDAVARMLPHFQPCGRESVPLMEAAGRFLATDVAAREAWPPFHSSAMDGYAVRWREAQELGALPVRGELRAGALPQPLAAKSAMRIYTGAPVPDGADTVVMQEDTEREGERVIFRALPKQGSHVRVRGSEQEPGKLLLPVGMQLGPAEIGSLAMQGLAEVEVFRRPRVAILPTGDELRSLTAAPRPYSIVDSNTYTLSTAVAQAGGIPVPLAIARDDLAELAARIDEGLQADVLITIGGVSVGEYDLVTSALRAAGIALDFHRVAIKPGKPLLFGLHGAKPVVGLPGNPVSALVTFEVFVRPGLQRMQGCTAPFSEPLEVELAHAYQHKPGRTEFVRARLSRQGGKWLAHVHAKQSSGALTTLLDASVLVMLPAQRTQFAEGERLPAIMLVPPRRTETPFGD
jgi:molybdopterin molybdotransferase